MKSLKGGLANGGSAIRLGASRPEHKEKGKIEAAQTVKCKP